MGRPAYRELYEHLKRDIMEQKYPVGELLPTEGQLEQMFAVSRSTIRRAVGMLAQEGFVEVKQGRGTLVLDYKAKQDLKQVTSVTETLRKKGYTVTVGSMYIDMVEAPSHVSQALMLKTDKRVARVQRIQNANGCPIAIMVNYIPASLVPGFAEYTDRFCGLYQFLEEHYHLVIEEVHDKIFAKNADFTEAQMLGVPVGEALLCFYRTCYQAGQPICFDDAKLIGKKYEVENQVRGRMRVY
ncbi:MAG TPA: GntR family transcriptional regulator [Firmicutes bacterium]|nr:GntR family transcriptional regulator [Bacillota bacterium]